MRLTVAGGSADLEAVYSHTIKLVRNDTAPELEMVLSDETTGVTLDTTNVASLLLKIKILGSTTPKAFIPLYKTLPYSSGIVFAHWTSAVSPTDGTLVSALDTAGILIGEIELTYLDGKILTLYEQIKFEVREDY